jgi:hypothetical protein
LFSLIELSRHNKNSNNNKIIDCTKKDSSRFIACVRNFKAEVVVVALERQNENDGNSNKEVLIQFSENETVILTINVQQHLPDLDLVGEYDFSAITFIGMFEKDETLAKTSGDDDEVPDRLLVTFWKNRKTNQGKIINWDFERMKRKLETSLLRGIVEVDDEMSPVTAKTTNASYEFKMISVVEKDEKGNLLEKEKQILVLQENHHQLIFFDPISWKRMWIQQKDGEHNNKIKELSKSEEVLRNSKSNVISFSTQTFKNCISYRKVSKESYNDDKRSNNHHETDEEILNLLNNNNNNNSQKNQKQQLQKQIEEKPVFAKLPPITVCVSVTLPSSNEKNNKIIFSTLTSQKINSNERRLIFEDFTSRSFEDDRQIQNAFFDPISPTEFFHVVFDTAMSQQQTSHIRYCFVWGEKTFVTPFSLLKENAEIKSLQFSPRSSYLYIIDNQGNDYTLNL